MLHVPHPLDGERGPGDESAQEQLAALLGRALNSFDLPDELIERLDSAMAHTTSLHSSLHTSAAGPAGHRLSRETYRHCYLLLDGTTVTLWELAHHDGREYAHEVYAAEEEARIAAARLRRRALPPDAATSGRRTRPVSWRPAFGAHGADACRLARRTSQEAGRPGLGPEPSPSRARLARHRQRPRASRAERRPAPRRTPRTTPRTTRAGCCAAPRTRTGPASTPRCDCGRRTRTGSPRRSAATAARRGRDAAFTLYEHAFLLLDGSELSLWEVEHTATPDGRHMCEVYASEQAARTAMERRAHVS